MAKHAAEIIAEFIGWDVVDVRENVYQPTVYRTTKLFTIGDSYYCCPLRNQKPPKVEGLVWVPAQKQSVNQDRTIWFANPTTPNL